MRDRSRGRGNERADGPRRAFSRNRGDRSPTAPITRSLDGAGRGSVIDGGAEFAALRLPNEGDDARPRGRVRGDGLAVYVPFQSAEFGEYLTGANWAGPGRGWKGRGIGAYSMPPRGSRPLRHALRICSRSSRSGHGGWQRGVPLG